MDRSIPSWSPASQEQARERLRRALDAWMETTGDDPLLPESQLVESLWPGGAQPATAPPTISVEDQRVTLTCPTDGAAIAYQVDGKGLEQSHWFLYSSPFEAPAGAMVSVTAIRVGYAQSAVVKAAVR